MKTPRILLAYIAGLAICVSAFAGVAPSSPVSLDGALRDAAKIAARHPGMKVMRVEGASMLPYFGEGSVLLVQETASAALKPGAVVVYKNNFGDTVAHRVIGGDVINGWVVKGYNNDRADTTRVTDANLIGTVYATLFAAKTPVMLASADDVGVAVAMAAPAR